MKTRVSLVIIGIFIGFTVIVPAPNSEANNGPHGVVINEVMYNPPGSDTGNEWIELYNNGSAIVDITHWVITDQDGSDDFEFPQLLFPPGAYIVIYTGQGENETDFSDSMASFYMWRTSSFLENTGDDILLLNATGQGVDYMGYDYGGSVDPFPLELEWDDWNGWIDTEGNSLSLHPNGLDTDSGLSWEESDPTPGRANAHLNDDPPQMNWVAHEPLNPGTDESVTITANITEEYALHKVDLHYTLNGTERHVKAMIRDGFNYTAQIPAQVQGTVVSYYINATDDAEQIGTSSPYSYAHSGMPVKLVINEFMADPGIDWNGDGYVDSDDEWIELHNPGETVINIGQWDIDDLRGDVGSSDPYTIPRGIAVEPGEFIVFSGSTTGILLNNNGDNVTLLDENDEVVDICTFPASKKDTAIGRYPDGSGNWEGFLLPTPGGANLYTVDTIDNLTGIRINEFLPRQREAYTSEWVELHNTGSTPVRLDGCWIDDVVDGGKKPFQIPLNTTINPGELVLFSGQFGLNNDGDSINLIYVDGSTIIDSYAYGFSEYDVSIGRGSDGDGSWTSFSIPTPGRSNGPASRPDSDEGSILISEVFYKASDEYEFLSLFNPSQRDVNIGSWRILDGQQSYTGSVIFPEGSVISPGTHLTIAHNAVLFSEITGNYPDFEYGNSTGDIPDLISRGTPGFSNEGDTVVLMDESGHAIDMVVYGDSEFDCCGWMGPAVPDVVKGDILVRNIDDINAGFTDTDSSSDWTHIKPFRIGQSAFLSEPFMLEGNMTLFVSPDSSYQAVINELEAAESNIHLCLYQFTNWHLAQVLLDKLNHSVSVRILMEGGPAGEWEEQQQFILQKVVEHGGEVKFMVYNSTLGSRYRYVHSKYAVIDGKSVIISSENWKYTGIPVNSTYGNRGWGVIIRDDIIADYFLGVFMSDWSHVQYDLYPFSSEDPKYGDAPSAFTMNDWVYSGYYNPVFFSKTITSPSSITPVISPDTLVEEDDPIVAMIAGAEKSIYIEQLDIALNWDEDDAEYENAYLKAAVEAAESRHVEVKILLSSLYASPDNPGFDNYDTYMYINDYAANHNISRYLEARLVDYDRLGLSKVHTKGMIVDGGSTLISSINWVRNSVTRNREVGVIIEDADVAAYFTGVFFWDWNEPPAASPGEDKSVEVNSEVQFDDLSTDPDDNIHAYTWDFGDGTNSTEKNPVHIFEDEGIYLIRLTVSDGQYTDSKTITVVVLSSQNDDSEGPTGVRSAFLLTTLIALIVVIAIFVSKMRSRFI